MLLLTPSPLTENSEAPPIDLQVPWGVGRGGISHPVVFKQASTISPDVSSVRQAEGIAGRSAN